MMFSRLPLHAALMLSLGFGLAGCSTDGSLHEEYEAGLSNWNALKSSIALEMAEDYFNSGQLALAQRTVEEAMANDVDNPRLWVMAGRIALENSELETAYRRLDRAIELADGLEGYTRKQQAEPYYIQGIVDQRWQRYDSAMDRYTLAYERDPENVSYFLARVEMLMELSRLDEAVAELEDKANYYDQNPTVRALLGHVYRRQGNNAQAAIWFRQASMLAPEDMKLHEEVARSLCAVGRYGEAIRTLHEIIGTEYAATRTDLHRMLADAYVQTGNLRDARDTYASLTRMDPTSVFDWSKLGEVAYQLQDNATALQAANRLINLAPDDHRGFLLAGMVWNRRDRLDNALSMFDRAAQLAPRDTTPLILRGIALQRNDRPAAAADAYRQALTVNPDDARAQRLLSSVTEDLH